MQFADLQISCFKIGRVLVAETLDEQIVGLMYKNPPLPPMAFVYSTPQVNNFWMKDTKAPLDIIFARDGKVVKICKGEPYSTELIGGLEKSDLVVELPYGSCEQMGITLNDEIKLNW